MDNRIKVIKKNEAAPIASKKVRKPAKEAAREVVSTVSDWVADVRDRKREEAKLAIDRLFSANTQPNES